MFGHSLMDIHVSALLVKVNQGVWISVVELISEEAVHYFVSAKIHIFTVVVMYFVHSCAL